MLKTLFYSRTAAALASWLGLLALVYTVLVRWIPEWFGQLSWPQSVLLGIGLALATGLVLALVAAIGGYGFRLFKPLPPPAPAESDRPSPSQRLQNRISTIMGCQGAVLNYRNVGGYFSDYIEANGSFMMIRRQLHPSFLVELESQRHTAADQSAGGELPQLARRFLDEVDRVAEQWGLE